MTASPAGAAPSDARPKIGLWAIFFGFTKVTMASIGGSLTAWSRRVLVDERRWVTNDEFLEALSVCQVLPGPNNVNLSIYIGRHLRGAWGAAVAVLGLVALPLVVIAVLTVLYFTYGSSPHVDRAMSGLNAATAGLIAATAFQLGSKHFRKPVALTLSLVTLGLVGILRVPMLPVILFVGGLSVAFHWWRACRERRAATGKEGPR